MVGLGLAELHSFRPGPVGARARLAVVIEYVLDLRSVAELRGEYRHSSRVGETLGVLNREEFWQTVWSSNDCRLYLLFPRRVRIDLVKDTVARWQSDRTCECVCANLSQQLAASVVPPVTDNHEATVTFGDGRLEFGLPPERRSEGGLISGRRWAHCRDRFGTHKGPALRLRRVLRICGVRTARLSTRNGLPGRAPRLDCLPGASTGHGSYS